MSAKYSETKAVRLLDAPHRTLDTIMNYHDLTLIIPILAAGYVSTIYLLLILAQRVAKMANGTSWNSGSIAESQSKS